MMNNLRSPIYLHLRLLNNWQSCTYLGVILVLLGIFDKRTFVGEKCIPKIHHVSRSDRHVNKI